MSTSKLLQWLVFSLCFTVTLSACDPGRTGQITDPDGLPAPVDIRVWVDKNQDGKRTVGEIPLSGVVVQLVDPSNGRVVDEQVTDSNGEAEIVGLQDLLPGYQVKVIVPENYVATTDATVSLAEVDYRSGPISIGIAPVGDS